MTGDGEDMVTTSKKECPFEDEIVSYMYGEIDGIERDEFETHLAKCMTCTDDFAAVSNARFSVFEWRKEEFDALATPHIVIPELAKPPIASGVESGWFGSLAGLLAFARSPMAVAAALLVCIGIGFTAITYVTGSKPEIASNKIEVPVVEDTGSETIPSAIVTPPGQVIEPRNTTGLKKVSATYKTIPAAPSRVVNTRSKRIPSPQIARKPVLNDFNDDTDDSLRLSVLLDEVGG